MKAVNETVQIVSVSEITGKIQDILEGNMSLRSVYVRGEISNLSRRRARTGTDYLYFTLKDDKTQLSCVMFEGVDGIGFEPRDGMSVVCEGMITVYPAYGKYQLKCYMMSEDGAGAASKALELLKARLLDEGLFAQKRPCPPLPRKIAVITSPTGAAIEDIKNVIGRRCPIVTLCVIPAYVQGVNAVPSLIEGINTANLTGADLIIIGRGGGSSEDLDCFNSEALARAIFASKIPTISAVGHETDTTIADLAADMRAPTPSAAAELAVPDIAVIRSDIEALEKMAHGAALRTLSDCENRLLMLEKDIRLHSPRERLARREARLEYLESALYSCIREKLDSAENRLMKAAQSVSDLNPMSVLSRGYSAVKKDGRIIKSADELAVGDIIDIKLHKGGASARITETSADG